MVQWLIPILGMLAQLAFVGVIVWAIVQGVGRRHEEPERVDAATSLRRLFEYGLMFTVLMLTAAGVVLVVQELVGSFGDEADADRTSLALGLAVAIVAGPTYALLLRHSRHRLQDDATERDSFGWAAYLNLALLVPLIATTVTAQHLLEGVTAVDEFEMTSVVPVIVWGSVWAVHWFWLKAAFGTPDDWHLTTGSLTGLVTLALGVGGLAFGVGNAIYTRVVEQVPRGHREPEFRTWAIAAFLGALIWSWHWLGHYLRAERTSLWHVYVVLIGSLGGLVAVVVSAATIGYRTLVWFAGDPRSMLASEHFQYVPAVPAATLGVGAVSWQYHRSVLQRRSDIVRTEPLRAYDYLVAGAGLVATVVGVTVALVALLEAITPEAPDTDTLLANRVILAVSLIVIGGPLWWVFWSRLRRQLALEPYAELASMVRRIYLIVLFGVGGIVVLISLITVLSVGIEDLLAGTFGGRTVRSFRVGISLVAAVSGVAGYHLTLFRSDRAAMIGMAPLPPPLPIPPRPPRHVLLIAPRGTALAEELTAATGADLNVRYRTDDSTLPEIDLSELVARIDAETSSDLLVVVGAGRTEVIPMDADVDSHERGPDRARPSGQARSA